MWLALDHLYSHHFIIYSIKELILQMPITLLIFTLTCLNLKWPIHSSALSCLSLLSSQYYMSNIVSLCCGLYFAFNMLKEACTTFTYFLFFINYCLYEMVPFMSQPVHIYWDLITVTDIITLCHENIFILSQSLIIFYTCLGPSSWMLNVL